MPYLLDSIESSVQEAVSRGAATELQRCKLIILHIPRECTFCKTECDRVIFTTSATLPYSAYPPSAIPFTDTRVRAAALVSSRAPR